MKLPKFNFEKLRPYLLIIGVLALLYFFGKSILEYFGIIDSDADKAKKDFADTMVERQTKLASQGVNPSASPAYWLTVANAIYTDLRYSSVSDNKTDAVRQLCKVQNELDLYILIEAFGFRQEYAFGIPIGAEMDLAGFVASNFGADRLQEVNTYLQKKVISYRF